MLQKLSFGFSIYMTRFWIWVKWWPIIIIIIIYNTQATLGADVYILVLDKGAQTKACILIYSI